ncbi:thioredoxin H2-like protein [Cinnamomum micranthum f. kanehirae]|uniref:Thioredoxin H2-like protein n=1 Tax=Cinnamomum micranthum f. kanehirae TaxID=337451 RepID=A0A443NGI4_9MAGN|nr:thioredoxin H2-like protein [Cinnamomum micranthum f. kanehirae]
MGAQISTNLSSGCSLREQRYLNLKSKADLGRYIKDANSTLMVINFTTTWCQPCIDAEPPMRKLAEEFPDVKFARVDIDLLQKDHANAPLEAVSGDDSQDVVKEFELKTMPTFLLCKKVDDGLDKGKGAAEVGGGNRISSSVVPSAIEEKRTTSIKGGNSVVPSATEGKSADSVKEGNKAAAGATGGKRAVNYEGKKVFIDEIYRMEGPLEGHELRKKIEYYKIQHTTSFKSTDEICSYLKKSKPTQLMVLNFTTEWCEPCKKADEPFKKLSKDYEDVKFAKVDVDLLMNIAEELNVKMMPTFLLVKVKKLEKEHVKKDGEQENHKDKKEPPEKEHVKKDGEQENHKDKKEPPEKEHVKKDGEQEDHKDKKEPPEKEHVKKDAVRGDHKDIKGPLEKEHVKMVKLAEVVGWNKEKERELTEMIKKHRYSTT